MYTSRGAEKVYGKVSGKIKSVWKSVWKSAGGIVSGNSTKRAEKVSGNCTKRVEKVSVKGRAELWGVGGAGRRGSEAQARAPRCVRVHAHAQIRLHRGVTLFQENGWGS